jgi:hypothetical protein
VKLPRALVINGERWRIVRKPLCRRGRYGQCNYRTREIQIDSELVGDERAETFVHELLHACLPEDWAPTAEERMIERLAPRLLSALRGLGWVP